MVELIDEDTSQTIARYEWDGMNRRIVKETFSGGIVDETRARARSWLHLDLYTDDQAQAVERLVNLVARRYPWRYEPE